MADTGESLTIEKGDCERNRSKGAVLLDMINKLPEAQRICVLLAYGENLKYAEVADILDAPVGTVVRRLSDARTAISAGVAISGGAAS